MSFRQNKKRSLFGLKKKTANDQFGLIDPNAIDDTGPFVCVCVCACVCVYVCACASMCVRPHMQDISWYISMSLLFSFVYTFILIFSDAIIMLLDVSF